MSKPAVEAHDLRKAFGEVQALDGLSLAVPTGSVLGLLVVAVMTGVGFAAGFRSPHGAGSR